MGKEAKAGEGNPETGSQIPENPETDQSPTSQGEGPPNSKESQGKEGASGKGDDSGEFDIAKLDPRAQKLIQNLRKENGDHRIKNKALADSHGKLKQALIEAGIVENDEDSPEDKLKNVSQGFQAASVRNAILEAALENDISKGEYEYFEFLVNKRASLLEEDGELTPEDLAEIANEARGRKSAGNQGGNGGTTSVGAGQGKPNPDSDGEVTVDQFSKMSITEKTLLFQKDQTLYHRLFAEAKNKKLIVGTNR